LKKRLLFEKAYEEGFDIVRIAKPATPPHYDFYEDWLRRNYHGEMRYLERNLELRKNPSYLLEGVKSVVVLATSYSTGGIEREGDARISLYAIRKDYHRTLKKRMKRVAEFLRKEFGGNYLLLCDSTPFLERDFASVSGVGFFGKNCNIIAPGLGSYFFLSEILTDVEFEADHGIEKNCGRCTLCINSCPTGAIVSPYTIDARKCISYLTVEMKGVIERRLREKLSTWVFGCDSCQENCPYNKLLKRKKDETLPPIPEFLRFSLSELFSLGEKGFNEVFKGTPVKRAGWRYFLRNVAVAMGNTRKEEYISPLEKIAEGDDPLLRIHAVWSIGKIGGERAKKILERVRNKEKEEKILEEIELAIRRAEGNK